MDYETFDSIAGNIGDSPALIHFGTAPFEILNLYTQRAGGQWTEADSSEGTFRIASWGVSECSLWCLDLLVRRLEQQGWTIDQSELSQADDLSPACRSDVA